MNNGPIRVLIVDDEPLARVMVRKMLHGDAEIEIVCECETGHEAIAAIRESVPDLIFLDVQMPEVDGFAVLKAFPADQLPYVIFVTAYDQYAVRAFEARALDYLLKPFDRERFEQALGRAKEQLRGERDNVLTEHILSVLAENKSRTQYLERLIVKTGGHAFLLEVKEIAWIEAEGNYVSLHVGEKKYLFREAISSLEMRLDPRTFRRIHRSTIVNLDCVRELQPMFRGDYRVILHSGAELKLSHRYRDNFDNHLGGNL